MKSIALTLAVLFATLSFAQAANEPTQEPAATEEQKIIDVNAQKNPDGSEEVQAIEETTEKPAQ